MKALHHALPIVAMVPMFIDAMLMNVALSAALAGASYLLGSLFPDKKRPKPPPEPAQAPDPKDLQPDAGGPLPCLLGYQRLTGKIALQIKYSNKTYLVITICGHRVSGVPGIYVNDALVSVDGSGNVQEKPWAQSGSYSMNVRILTGAQVAVDSALNAALPGWSVNHIGKETTYAIVLLNPAANTALFGSTYNGGIPAFSFDVIGDVCYDPRNGAHNIANKATWTFSANASIIEANYVIHPLGMNEPTSLVDWTSVAASANVDDQAVTLANGGSERRFAACLYWEANEKHEAVLERIGAAHASMMRFRGRKWVATPGEFGTSSATITSDDYADGGINISEAPPLSRRVNGVRGKFRSPQHNWELKDFPSYQDATALADDGGFPEWLEIQFDCVSSHSQAQRLARIAYKKARLGYPVSVDLKFRCFDIVADDVITVNDAYLSLAGATYRVQSDELTDGDVVSLQLEYETAAFYSWTAGTDEKVFEAVDIVGGELGNARLHGMALIDTNPAGITVNATIYPPPSFPIGADNYALVSGGGGALVWTGALTSTVTGSVASNPGGTNSSPWALQIRNAANAVLQSVSVSPGANSNVDTLTEATTTFFVLPAPKRPLISSFGAGSVTLKAVTPPGTKVTHVELWGGATNVFGSATLLATTANASGASFVVTGTPGSVTYYWFRYKSGATVGPESNPTLVVFS